MKVILLDEAKKWLEENCENQYTRVAVFGIMQSMPAVDYQETPNETPPCYQPDGDGCAYQCYDGQDEPIEKCKACPLCCSDKQRYYTPPNELTCEGCIHERKGHENCNYCMRASWLNDYYFHPSKGENFNE